MLTLAHEAWLANTCSYVKDMTCQNNLDINEIWPKDNNDMTQCVTCNFFSLFASRLKSLKKQKERQRSLWSKNLFECSWSEGH
jgi:Zn ribbon nucleic-acid-binding protein